MADWIIFILFKKAADIGGSWVFRLWGSIVNFFHNKFWYTSQHLQNFVYNEPNKSITL